MNPPTGQGTGDLKPPWRCPGKSRSGSLKVLLVISPSFSLHASCCVSFFVLTIKNSFPEFLKLKFPHSQPEPFWLCAGECVSCFHGWVSQGWLQQERFRKIPSLDGPAAHGALPTVGPAVHRLHCHQHKLPKHNRSSFWKRHILSFFPPPASGHRFHSSLDVPSKILFHIL